MATEIDTRIWTDENVIESFIKSLKSIEISIGNPIEWGKLKVAQNAPGNIIHELNELDTLSEIEVFVSNLRDKEELNITLYFSLDVARFVKGKVLEGSVQCAISFWGNQYGRTFNLDQTKEGNGQLSILNVGPYCAVIGDQRQYTEVNNKVSENIENYIDLLQHIIRNIDPKKVLVFTDAGEYVITNAHLAYFKNNQELNKSFDDFVNLLNATGREVLDDNSGKSHWFLHEWRDLELQQSLREKLLLIANKTKTKIDTAEKARTILENGNYDFFEFQDGLLILDYPYTFNSFLDAFVFDVIH